MYGNSLTRFVTKTVSDSITRPANTTQYTVGDVIAEASTDDHFYFPEVAKVGFRANCSGLISGAILYSSANQSTKLAAELFLFSSDVAEDGDNAAWTPTDAELLTCVGKISFAAADWVAGDVTSGAGGNALCQASNLGLAFNTVRDSSSGDGTNGSLYGVLIAANTYTPVSGETFTVSLQVAQD